MARKLVLLTLALFLLGPAPKSVAQEYPRYESKQWVQATTPSGKKYYYNHYHYAPEKEKYHHAYYYPYKSKRYIYYYNWKKKRYWGRYDLESGLYSLLPDGKKKEHLDEIEESDFPAPKPLDQVSIPPSGEDEGPTGRTMTPPPLLPQKH